MNQLTRAYAESRRNVVLVDSDKPLLIADGKLRPELYVEDGLHLSPADYKIWVSLLGPHLN